MALLRNLEQSLSGLVEGTIGRVFRTEVRPTEIARKLAREMEINKRVSLSRTYAPTDYIVYLSPDDRARYAGVEGSIAEELGAYLLEHARRERLVLVRRPLVEFRTDKRLHLGEFGIEARTAPISAEEAPARPDPDAAAPAPRPAAPAPERPRPAPSPSASDRYAEPEPPSRDDDGPLGSTPASGGYEPPSAIGPIDDAPYEDPYAGDPFNAPEPQRTPEADAVVDRGWQDGPASGQQEAVDPAASSAQGDWLDPVDDWHAPGDDEQAAPRSADGAPAPQPRAEQPFRPTPRVPEPGSAAANPWIDPTLSRPSRPQFAPPVIPPRPPAQQAQPTQPAAPAAPPAPPEPRTTILVDGTAHELTGDRVVLGRSRTADIVISDPSVSRQHCELRRQGSHWVAADLGSTNGTELAGASLKEPRRIEPGMRIKLGHAAAIIEVR